MSVLARPGLGIISNVSSLATIRIAFLRSDSNDTSVEGTKEFLSIVLSPIVSIVSADREDAAAAHIESSPRRNASVVQRNRWN